MSETTWHDTNVPDSLADSLNNLEWALTEMRAAINDGRYRYERVHVEADLHYLLGEVRRAKRQRETDESATSQEDA